MEQQKDDFIGIASHELKTPVTSIKAYAEVLHETFLGSGDTASATLLEKLDVQVDRLIELIKALLDTSKIAEGKLILKPEQFKLNTLVKERTEDLQRLSNRHQLTMHSKEEITITADRERIGQALTNLISNAIKYSPKGGNIDIALNQLNNEVQVSIKDEGIGISEGARSKVFDRFFREESVQKQNFSGMGLGLYVTAKIIFEHGGKIWVESIQGEGSIFYFTLPGE